MENTMTSVDLGKMIYLDPSKQAKVTLLKAPRKLKKKMKKEGSWGMPLITFEAESLISPKDLNLIFKGHTPLS
ncbi:hypothetical protein ACLCDV_07980 [Sphingobacterium sp. Lzh-3]|uniref:hypothetical protein n=1 Tax=Sphingobacterium sp. Lzh-3 TaxID=3382150 RepID=UPI00398CB30D